MPVAGRSSLQSRLAPAVQAWSQVVQKHVGVSFGLSALCWLVGCSMVSLVGRCSVLPGKYSCITLGLLFLPLMPFLITTV